MGLIVVLDWPISYVCRHSVSSDVLHGSSCWCQHHWHMAAWCKTTCMQTVPTTALNTRLSWSDSEWQRVIFCDELHFCLGGDSKLIHVWLNHGQHQKERFVVLCCPEGLVCLHFQPYCQICRKCMRIFKLHGRYYRRHPYKSTIQYYKTYSTVACYIIQVTVSTDAP